MSNSTINKIPLLFPWHLSWRVLKAQSPKLLELLEKAGIEVVPNKFNEKLEELPQNAIVRETQASGTTYKLKDLLKIAREKNILVYTDDRVFNYDGKLLSGRQMDEFVKAYIQKVF